MIWTILAGLALVLFVMMMAMMAMMVMMQRNASRAVRGGQAFAKAHPERLPTFTELDTGFRHKLDLHAAQPMVEMCLLDIGDKLPPALFVTGGKGQSDALLAFRDGAFVDLASEFGLAGSIGDISYSATADDIDGDGQQELIVGRQSGVYVYSRAAGQQTFAEAKIDIALPADATPVGLATSDTTNSGNRDLFISTFIDHSKHSTANFNDPAKRVANAFWRNNGDGTFRDASSESGLDLHHNTFLGQFVDLNQNGFDDLILGTNTAPGFVFENLKDGTFKKHQLPIGHGFWMGVGTHDFTGNGFPDIYLTNTGTSVPSRLMKGDLKSPQKLDTSYRLLANDGTFNFTDVASDYGLDNPGFGWGMVIEDLTNNGEVDILIAENFRGMPMNIQKHLGSHGTLYVKGTDGRYQNVVMEAGLSNKKEFGYRVIAADLSGNGFKDVFIANVDGPLRAFLNDGK